MLNVNGKLRNCTFWIIKRMAPVLLVLTWPWHFMALVLTTLRRNMQLKDPRHYMYVDGMLSLMFVMHLSATGEAPYCEAKNDERKWCQKEDRSHGLVSTADTARQGRRKKNNAAKLSRLF